MSENKNSCYFQLRKPNNTNLNFKKGKKLNKNKNYLDNIMVLLYF